MIVNKFGLKCIVQDLDENEDETENYITLVSYQYAVDNKRKN
jgi:hypothetical protein